MSRLIDIDTILEMDRECTTNDLYVAEIDITTGPYVYEWWGLIYTPSEDDGESLRPFKKFWCCDSSSRSVAPIAVSHGKLPAGATIKQKQVT